jgi:hypothetical protein
MHGGGVTATEQRAIGDMKAGLTGGKPKLSILPRAAMNYMSRAIEYGADKYARGNYHGPPPGELGSGYLASAMRLLGYLDAAMRHLTRVSDAINHALGTGKSVKEAAGTVDDDGGGKFPPSNLPDLAHALASIGLGITCAVDDGLLPYDPGRPWDALRPTAELPQKSDPAAERARVLSLQERNAVLDGTPMALLTRPRIVVTDEDRKWAEQFKHAIDPDPRTPANVEIVRAARAAGDTRHSAVIIAESLPARELAARASGHGFTPPGFAPCTREASHSGPCAHPPAAAFGEPTPAPTYTKPAGVREGDADVADAMTRALEFDDTGDALVAMVSIEDDTLDIPARRPECFRDPANDEPRCGSCDVPLETFAWRASDGLRYRCRLTTREVTL